MTGQSIMVRPISDTDISAVTDLMLAQMIRWHALDARLTAPRGRDEIVVVQEQALVAADAHGRIRGYVRPELWIMPPEHEMLTFFTARNGTFQHFILPTPTDEDVEAVLLALLEALSEYWREQNTTGDMLRWPICDLWFEPQLLAHGFRVDNILAYRGTGPLPAPLPPVSPLFHARLARPEDEEALVRLHLQEIQFHVSYTPFVHIVPALEQAFRARLAQLWSEESLEEGAPLVVVVEKEHEVIAFAENELLVVEQDGGRPGMLLPGRYGYLNNVGVEERQRGQGVGHLLVQAVFDAFAAIPLDGYMLWYSPDNPLAQAFWPHRGFQPLWKTYQRLHLT